VYRRILGPVYDNEKEIQNQEEILESITFPPPKAEPDEVSYVSVLIIRHLSILGKFVVNGKISKYMLISHHKGL
jgi:hypothetical protein